MWRRSLAMAGLCGLLLTSACRGGGVPEWGDEAIAYVDAFDEAVQQSGGAVLSFYGPEVTIDDPASVGDYGAGRAAIGGVITAVIDEAVLGDFAIDRRGLAIELRWLAEEPGAATDMLLIREVGDGGLAAVETLSGAVADVEGDASSIFSQSGLLIDTARLAPALVAAYLDAWSSSDPNRVGALYGTDAHIEDSLLRIGLDGRPAIRSFVDRAVDSELRLRTTPDGGDAVYVRWPDGFRDVVARRMEVTISYTSDDGSGCPGRTTVTLSIVDGGITEERRYHDVEDLRRCVDADELPDGWWTGLEPPELPEDEVTGVVEVGRQEIEIRNGTPALDRLVAWGFDRFVDAGLGAPAVDAVAFDASAHAVQCADRRHGLALDLGEATQLYLCFEEEQACADEDCDELRLRVRQLMLHEIGHAWLNDHVGEQTQQAFVDLMGLEGWRGESIRWSERGVEQAANVLAWGVTDERVDATGDTACAELTAAFELLTGERPQQVCARTVSG